MITTSSTGTAGRSAQPRPPRRRGALAAACVAVASALCALVVPVSPAPAAAAATAAAATAPPPLPQADSHGIDTTDWRAAPGDEGSTEADWRLLEATMVTSAVYRDGPTPAIKVRILLPANYQTDPANPYPVLWLLHGGIGDYRDWTNMNVKSLVPASGFEGIVVMPEGGSTGYFTDWWGHADNGASPAWETFHIDQLLGWVDANFNTDATRGGRSIAGLSMGGFGALKYAGQHPDLFSAVGSFSGATNIRLRDTATGGSANAPATISQHMQWSGACIVTINCILDLSYRVNLYENGWPVQDDARQEAYRVQTLFGPESNYGNVNPFDMAGAYAAYGGRVALYSGGEQTGERDMYAHNLVFHQELNRLGIGHRWCVGNGTHSSEYWQRDLTDFLAFIGGTPIACHYDDA